MCYKVHKPKQGTSNDKQIQNKNTAFSGHYLCFGFLNNASKQLGTVV